ncbi:hypothetical protein HanIR_Chr09g0432171 [Helianthus annuus]|nr:hypothetical protein HanIR_Chr09g0432171 [Helianthus annuus]
MLMLWAAYRHDYNQLSCMFGIVDVSGTELESGFGARVTRGVISCSMVMTMLLHSS